MFWKSANHAYDPSVKILEMGRFLVPMQKVPHPCHDFFFFFCISQISLKMKYGCNNWTRLASSSLYSFDKVQKRLAGLVGHRSFFQPYISFPSVEMLQAYRYAIVISMANFQPSYIPYILIAMARHVTYTRTF